MNKTQNTQTTKIDAYDAALAEENKKLGRAANARRSLIRGDRWSRCLNSDVLKRSMAR